MLIKPRGSLALWYEVTTTGIPIPGGFAQIVVVPGFYELSAVIGVLFN